MYDEMYSIFAALTGSSDIKENRGEISKINNIQRNEGEGEPQIKQTKDNKQNFDEKQKVNQDNLVKLEDNDNNNNFKEDEEDDIQSERCQEWVHQLLTLHFGKKFGE